MCLRKTAGMDCLQQPHLAVSQLEKPNNQSKNSTLLTEWEGMAPSLSLVCSPQESGKTKPENARGGHANRHDPGADVP